MARSNIEKKHADIKRDYEKLYKDGYRWDVIVSKLAEKYYMTRNTIENLIWGTAGYGQKKKKSTPIK